LALRRPGSGRHDASDRIEDAGGDFMFGQQLIKFELCDQLDEFDAGPTGQKSL
jgi:hypothetical protein